MNNLSVLIETSSSVVWKESELNKEERALLKTVVSVIGQSAKRPIQLDDNFFDVGGNSLNAVSVVTKLQDQGFFIGNLNDFICRPIEYSF